MSESVTWRFPAGLDLVFAALVVDAAGAFTLSYLGLKSPDELSLYGLWMTEWFSFGSALRPTGRLGGYLR